MTSSLSKSKIVTRQRRARVERITRETGIVVEVDLDDATKRSIKTPVPFFDHMLDTLSCHGRFGLIVEADGDVEVDPHHLVEDVGIVLGDAYFQALGSLKGIERAGCFS
ncbi:MAG: hypothetical protein AB7W16_28615, partial [Candidatus Obscuribacterales bacterium]